MQPVSNPEQPSSDLRVTPRVVLGLFVMALVLGFQT